VERLEVIEQILTCTNCALVDQCSSPVPFRGAPSRVAVVGEAPGETEDKVGKPFVGPAGRLLGSLLHDAGLDEPMGVLNTVSCLGGKTKVFLADGSTERIEKLVKDRYEGQVLCADGDGNLVARQVIGWHRNSIAGRKMYHVTHIHARSNMHGRVGVTATGDHEVLTKRGWIAVDQIKRSDEIHTGMAGLDAPARQVVLSGILGDATVDQRTRTQIEFCSGSDEADYIRAKHDLLEVVVGPTSRGRGWPRLGPVDLARGAGDGWRFRLTHPEVSVFAMLRPSQVVRLLDDFGLALWYMDDGHLRVRADRRPDAQIAIARMPEDEAEAVAEELRIKGFSVAAKRTAMGMRLMFGVDGTETLLTRIGKYVHPTHARKSVDGERVPWPKTKAIPLWGSVIVAEIAAPETVYCLSVEEHQNFVTVGGVVHNCFPHGTPELEHITACAHNKWTQISYLDPTYLLLLGNVALKGMRRDLSISHARARPFLMQDRICFATYHPAAALRNGSYETTLAEDLVRFRSLLDAGPDHWMDFIPDTCAECNVDAIWFEDNGLGWCPLHLPAAQVPAFNRRQNQLAAEMDAARHRAQARRDTAIAAVEANADDDWLADAYDALVAYLKRHPEFFVDDFWIGTQLRRPRESRALGAVVMKAARHGLMRKSGEFRKSTASNLTEKPVWESLICRRP
jgi:uracil-DNA glycosylase